MKKLFIIFFSLSIIFLCEQTAYSTVLFQSDVESASTCADVFKGDVNAYDGGACTVSTAYARSGTKSIRLAYPNDEAGVELRPSPFSATPSLYTRKYEYFPSTWAGNWPIGLKTSRYFSNGTAYHSEKMIWQTYDATCNEQFGMGMNSAINSPHGDYEKMYTSQEIFKNGLPYIRTGHWYKIETWMVMNSGVGVHDGVLQIWIDDVQVYNNNNMDYRNENYTTGTGWTNMWFGGNYSGAICGNPSTTLYRYTDDFYLSTTLDRENPPPSHNPSPPTGLTVVQ